MIKSLVLVHSYHHHNTEKIAQAIARVLQTEIVLLKDISPEETQSFDLIGFGAGIDSGKHYKPMLDFAESLPVTKNKKAFIFSTSGVYGKKKMLRDHAALREILTAKGYVIVDEFGCAGLDTNSFLKYIGGLNKKHPNNEDLQAAKTFAETVLAKTAKSTTNL